MVALQTFCWLNTNYAKLLFETYGDRVKIWMTFNEPYDYCIPGYGDGNYPPMGHEHGVADYLCMDTTLKAHAAVYRLYKEKFFENQKGKIGITLSSRFYFNKKNNATLVDRGMQYAVSIEICSVRQRMTVKRNEFDNIL